jgi:hypothetical protein
MYICPTCNRQFNTPEAVAKHSLGCWKEHNPNHISKPALHSEDITERKINNDIMSFFNSLQKEN